MVAALHIVCWFFWCNNWRFADTCLNMVWMTTTAPYTVCCFTVSDTYCVIHFCSFPTSRCPFPGLWYRPSRSASEIVPLLFCWLLGLLFDLSSSFLMPSSLSRPPPPRWTNAGVGSRASLCLVRFDHNPAIVSAKFSSCRPLETLYLQIST